MRTGSSPALAVLLFIGCNLAAAQQNAELDALALADQSMPAEPAARRNWQATLETAATSVESRTGARRTGGELALDVRLEHGLGDTVRAVGAARLGRFDPPQPGMEGRSLAMVKEAYLNWKAGPTTMYDVGLVNLRQGAAVGYNPTDFFRANAVIGNTADPDGRRTNRLGSVMLRAQHLTDDGAVALVFAPRLASPRQPGEPLTDDALRRTNNVNRWMLSASRRFGETLRPQLVLYGEEGGETQLGFNASLLASNAAVAYAEWTGGRARTVVDQATGRAGPLAFRARSAIGVTYTFPFDASLTVEWESNGAGVNAAQARSAAMADPLAWGATLQWAAANQESVTQHTLFVYLRANNVVLRKLDLSAIAQRDKDDAGYQYWAELRKRGTHADLAVQYQRQGGDAWTRFGAFPERSRVRLLLDYYF